jgi:hypothetical protein
MLELRFQQSARLSYVQLRCCRYPQSAPRCSEARAHSRHFSFSSVLTFAPLRLCVRFFFLSPWLFALENQHLIPFGDLAQDPGCIPVC